MTLENQARICQVASAVAIVAGIVWILMGGFSPNPTLIGATLLIIGAIGLYAGMKFMSGKKD